MPAPVEAVIISGRRKGHVVRIDPESLSMTPEVEAAVVELIDLGREISKNLSAANAEAEALRRELRPKKGGKRGAA